jgi:hypothetical protein
MMERALNESSRAEREMRENECDSTEIQQKGRGKMIDDRSI